MEQCYQILQDNQCPPENYRRLLFDALGTGPNHVFNEWIQRITDNIEVGFGKNVNVPTDKLIVVSRTKFNNMAEKKDWLKVNPRAAQILALATKLQTFESNSNENESGAALATTTGTNTGTTGGLVSRLPKWRTINSGATKTIDGAQFWWCPNHKHKDGLWDGLYVRHLPEKHDEDEKHDEIMGKYANKRKAPEVEVNEEQKMC